MRGLIPGGPTKIEDAAKRVADQYALHRVADQYGAIGRWFAVRLNDGTSDGVLYESQRDAVRHQKHDETFYAFVQVTPGNMTPQDAQAFLDVQRRLYDAGLKMADPDHKAGGRQMIRRLSQHDQTAQERALFVGDRPPSNIIYVEN